MITFFLRALDRLQPPAVAHAHCDIPCGIYNIHAATTAAQTVRRMTQGLLDLPQDKLATHQNRNTFMRMVLVKEEHAQLCKDELQMLWSDYFKPEHLDTLPDLHETIWHGVKLCSAAKRGVDLEAAEELEKTVAKVGEMMEKVRG
jgi:nickel superoxide dismutase